ncbi:sensor histidine kinase [Paenibacillus hexagrammi]|uniref:Heme sensor protein HssS n=1 Tax=Paenibacillus hexagrammi TaxID=2908839 RepID=A0ABY3SDK3_9BACL|nr:HAMP domain-containing sensor histidine kinase [Paenibacillus sp. YPD9-1]UJF31560.1 HAMP domain-containing histidine kinase [Paenibacillus sp. YPD9-1]
MIKTLYLRVVLTFTAVVIVSVLLSFPISLFLYTNQITTEIQNKLLSVGKSVAKMSQEVNSLQLESLLTGSTELNDGYILILYDSLGHSEAYGVQVANPDLHISEQDVKSVLQGKAYKGIEVNYRDFRYPATLRIGVPLTVSGKPYALFVMPQYTEAARKQINIAIISVLSIVLVLGSIFILVASRYIVNPIKKLTLATNRLARGNFDVNVTVKQKDELGLLADSFNHMAGELKQLEQMRQDFVSNVSHEIQSPLTSIRGFSKALRQPDLKEESRLHYLEIIERESERLSRLSENLLKLASLESEHHPFQLTTFDLDEQLRRVVVFYEPQWSEKKLDMELKLPKVKISADADQLNQVWVNLLGNAIKFTPEHGKIEVSLIPYTDHVQVSIKDTGIGIRKEDQEQIFTRFYKGDTSRERSKGGSGLGLAIVRKIIDVHQGTIEVQSELGQGAIFIVSLPILTKHRKK